MCSHLRSHYDATIVMLREAVAVQDALKYDDPAGWFFPVRESLGAALLMNGDAAGAEKCLAMTSTEIPESAVSVGTA